MLGANVWRRVLGVDRTTVIEEIDFDEESETAVVHVRPRRPTKRRCGRCGIRAPGYDQGEGRRNWRAIDLGTMQCLLQADSPRVNCPEHGPTVAQVPWARHGAGHTRFFDDQVAWLVTHTAKSTVCELMRIAWRTVGSIIARVVTDGRAAHDPFDGLVRIGIDEISYKKGHPTAGSIYVQFRVGRWKRHGLFILAPILFQTARRAPTPSSGSTSRRISTPCNRLVHPQLSTGSCR